MAYPTEDTNGGAVSEVQAQTDANGVATAQTWELGPYHATYTVMASLRGSDGEPVRFSAATTSAFELVVHGIDTLDPEAREQIDRAVRRWQGAIVEPLSPIAGTLDSFAAQCDRQAPASPFGAAAILRTRSDASRSRGARFSGDADYCGSSPASTS